jgi:excisionase family DNA binding protein
MSIQTKRKREVNEVYEYQMFSEYKDVVSVDDVTKMLHLSRVTVYKLLKAGRIRTLKVGKKYIIPKQSIIDFIAI